MPASVQEGSIYVAVKTHHSYGKQSNEIVHDIGKHAAIID